MFKSHFLEGDPVKRSFFKKYTNKLTKLKALSKKLYYSKELKNNQNDPRKTWDVIRSALPASNKRSTDTPQSLKINECRTNDPQKIADHFNEFFFSIGANLANSVDNSDPKSFLKYLSQRVSPSIYLDTPDFTEVYNAINSLNINKATGYDNTPARFLRISTIRYYTLSTNLH